MSNMFPVPLPRIDVSLRELFKLAGAPQGGSKTGSSSSTGASSNRVSDTELSPPGRCQRTTHPDGKPFWSYTWQSSTQNLAPQEDPSVQAQQNRNASAGEQHRPAA